MVELAIHDLHVSVEEKEILKGLDLTIQSGERHALMGPNGNGKSTLLAAIMGNPKYTVTQGTITLDGKDNSDFLRSAINARREKPIGLFQFIKQMEGAISSLQMKSDLAHRFVNDGFSGGEKKRNEIVQMTMLKPSIAMLDEIDSGLDVDALRIVADAVMKSQEECDSGLIIVSHYARFLEYLKPTHAHILIDGQIVASGDATLVEKVDKEGYEWIEEEVGVQAKKEEKKQPVSLGACAVKPGV